MKLISQNKIVSDGSVTTRCLSVINLFCNRILDLTSVDKLASIKERNTASEAVIQNGNGGRPHVPALIEAKVKQINDKNVSILMMDWCYLIITHNTSLSRHPTHHH